MIPPASMPSSPLLILHSQPYNLRTTLVDSGQAFGWEQDPEGWVQGVIGQHVFQLKSSKRGILWRSSAGERSRDDLCRFLQLNEDWAGILKTFPDDEYLRQAVQFAPGLRLARQEPWECLASFLISPLKQISQIKQVLASLRRQLGRPIHWDGATSFTFPDAEQIARAGEACLRAHRMGFRARNLLGTAKQVATGEVDLKNIETMDDVRAREELCKLRGVGPKIADCILLFAYGRMEAFPIDVWIERVMRTLYFPRARKLSRTRLEQFATRHFGPWRGYAQQFLFYYVRHHPFPAKKPLPENNRLQGSDRQDR